MLYKFHLQDVKVLLLGRTNENPPWRHEGRKTAYHHVVLILSGSCKCRIEHRTYDLAAGDLLYIPGEKFYKFTTKDHCEYFFACFTARTVSETIWLIKTSPQLRKKGARAVQSIVAS